MGISYGDSYESKVKEIKVNKNKSVNNNTSFVAKDSSYSPFNIKNDSSFPSFPKKDDEGSDGYYDNDKSGDYIDVLDESINNFNNAGLGKLLTTFNVNITYESVLNDGKTINTIKSELNKNGVEMTDEEIKVLLADEINHVTNTKVNFIKIGVDATQLFKNSSTENIISFYKEYYGEESPFLNKISLLSETSQTDILKMLVESLTK